jgi:hypothetical protein
MQSGVPHSELCSLIRYITVLKTFEFAAEDNQLIFFVVVAGALQSIQATTAMT